MSLRHAHVAAFALAVLSAGARLPAAEFSLDGREALAIGYRPAAIELVDLDRDGDLDLIVVNQGEFVGNVWNGCTVHVFHGAGGGAFSPPVTYVVPEAPSGLAVADLTGDTWLDLAIPAAAPDVLAVLVNDGHGAFIPGATIPVSGDPVAVVAADFNGDNAIDLASADQFGFGVSVALNLGGGSFGPATFYGLGDLTNGLQGGDIDGDQDTDLVAFCNGGAHLLRNAGGQFTAAPLGLGPLDSRTLLVRFDPDDRLDFVSGSAVRLGNGDGTFGAALPTGLAADWVRACDFDADGDTDVLTGAAAALNNGNNTFAAPIDFDPPPNSGPIAVGEFTGDARLDLVRCQGGVAGPIGFVALLPGRGDGTVPVFARVPAGDSVWALAAGRIDADSHIDLVAANIGTPFGQFLNGSAAVLTGRGDGTFNPFAAYPAGDYVRTIELADLDGDTDIDAALTNFNAGTVTVLRNAGGVFAAPVTYPGGANPEALAIADFDGVNGPDIAVANYRLGTLPGQVSVLLADGAGGFAAPVTYTLPGDRASDVIAADLNGDTAPDLAVVCGGRYFGGQYLNFGLYVLLNQGQGTFAPAVSYATRYLPRTVSAADLDGDTDRDLLVTTHGPTVSVLLVGEVLSFLNAGYGTFAAPLSTLLTNDHFAVVCADLNGDARPDLAAPYLSSSVVTLLPGVGDGTFGPAEHYATGKEPRGVAAADLNADTRLDLAVAHSTINSVGALLQRPAARRGDLNCDGRVNFDDINPFVLILSDPNAWQAAYPSCPPANGDCNGDGRVSFDDINPFVALLTGS
ncbi:MAG: VCBS repeat-containing protein [Planctomycetota bacterium]